MDHLSETFRSQDGIISRRQLLEHDVGPPAIARMVRRRELARVHLGVYAEHTGPLSWHQRAWAAVLFSWPAALTHDSALRAAEGPARRDRDEETIHVAVERERRLVEPPGVRIHRTAALDDRVRWNLGPPRVRYEHAVLDVAGTAGSDLRAIAVLAEACGSRRSTAQRLVAALDDRTRQTRRAWIASVLDDVAAGTCSVLEQGYLSRVERPHGLPVGRRQASHRHAGEQTLRDVDYEELKIVIELDGRLFHDSATQRDRDMDRDLDSAAADGSLTIRLSWGQVFDRPCRTASRVAVILRGLGWPGELTPCPDCG